MAQNRKESSDWKFWGLVVLLFAFGLGPIAMLLILGKLFAPDEKRTQAPPLQVDPKVWQQAEKADSRAKTAAKKVMRSPKLKESNAKLLMIAGMVLACVGLMGALDALPQVFYWTASALRDLAEAVAMLVGGGAMMGAGWSMKKALKRYAAYLAVMGDEEAVPLETLARKTGFTLKQVRRDLQNMVSKGYFGGRAYVDMELGYFFRSSEADRKLAQERTAKKQQKQAEAKRAEENEYQRILREIRQVNDEIADPELTRKINRLEEITASIFRVVERDAEKRSRISTFLNYYLPTTQKLLESYARFESAGVEGENLRQAKARIEQTMDSIVAGFEHQLDQLYQDDAMDVDSDIRVMETMLQRDTASAARDFGLDGSMAVAEEEE